MRSPFLRALICGLMLLCGALGHAGAQGASALENQGQGQGQRKPLPFTTGTSKTAMDAPESNNELEQYAHAPSVAAVSRRLGLSTNKGSRLLEDINSGVLIAVVLYFLLKLVPGRLRAKREGIDRELREAREATAGAEARMKQVEARLAALGGEIEAMRAQAARQSGEEEARIHAALEAERERIVRSAEQEIAAAQSNAERGLKRYASDLAVDRAAERVRLSADGDRALVDEFLQGLAGQIGKQGQN